MFFCQTPFIPEMLFQSDDLGIVRQNFHQRPMGLMNKVLVNDDDIEVFKYTLSQRGKKPIIYFEFLQTFFIQTGTVRAAINFYRALLRYQCDFLQATITAPVLLLWGCQDRLYGEDLAESSRKYCSNIQVKKVVNSSHWVNQDIPEIVNQYMEIFLNERPAQAHIYDF
jgi:pimeloyl-ACP methyl ester carboxylesterase